MSICFKELFPNVFKSNERQTLYVRLSESDVDPALLTIKIQPMEKHTIAHTPKYRIDEEWRYSYVPLTAHGEGLYSVAYDFTAEQQYSVKVKYEETVVAHMYVYSVDPDLAALKVFKGDTHLHSCRSDGKGTPFEVACAYRAAGFDFIAITDHHKFAPSLEAQQAVKALTDQFYVFRGEEVHNKTMGYFHIVNFNGESSVNDIIETDDDYVEAEIQKILDSRDFSGLFDPRCVAYRIFVADHIRKAKGLAIMAHPYWEYGGEYHMQTEEFIYHWQHGDFDALEAIASCDGTGHGNNLQEALRCELLAEGYKIPVVGASDAHTTIPKEVTDHFQKQFSLVFAKDYDEILSAIKDERGVAIDRTDDVHFRAVGKFRYVKYARFLMQAFYPPYASLCASHAEALASGDKKQIAAAEKQIDAFKKRFFAF